MYATPSDSTKSNKLIYVFELNQDIDPAASRITKNAIAEAEKLKASHLVLDLNTYGGLVSEADIIRTALLKTKIPTLVFIRNNAASAGALISIACDSIYMNEGATIGAAAVVYESGEMAPEKYQSYMRNKMRATAEATNRNPDIAEGMVDPKVEIKGITTKEEIITFTVNEAIKHDYCIAKAQSIDDVLELAQLNHYDIKRYKISKVESIISFFVNPAVAGFLLMIIMAGIYFELQTPGIGFPILASLIAAILYFTPHYLEGLAANWEIVLFIVGLLLLALEIFVIPGFGIAGIAGITALVISLTLSLIHNVHGLEFGFVAQKEIMVAFLTVAIVFMGSLFALFFVGDTFLKHAFARSSLGLKTEQKKEDGFIISAKDALKKHIGKEAIAQTDLRPAGKILIENEWVDAQSDGEFIKKGENVRVLKISGAYLIVEKIIS